MAETQTPPPLAALEQLVKDDHGQFHDPRISWQECRERTCADARAALAQVEAVVAAAWRDHRDATGHLRPGEFGVINPDTYASMGCKSCAALVPFGKEGP